MRPIESEKSAAGERIHWDPYFGLPPAPLFDGPRRVVISAPIDFPGKGRTRFLHRDIHGTDGAISPVVALWASGWWVGLCVFAGGFQGHGVVSHCRLILTGKLSAVFRWRG